MEYQMSTCAIECCFFYSLFNETGVRRDEWAKDVQTNKQSGSCFCTFGGTSPHLIHTKSKAKERLREIEKVLF